MTAMWLCVVLLLQAQPHEEAAAAARAYAAGRHAEALARYEAALEHGAPASAALLFNMGNCAYRLDRHAEAVLLYRRAARRAPGDAEVDFNRRLAERQLGVDSTAQAAPEDPAPGVLAALAVAVVQLIGLGGLVRARTRAARAAFLAVALAGAAGGSMLVAAAFARPTELGVVLADDVAVRGEPHVEMRRLFDLRAGETVRVEERSDRWMRITHPRGTGWVQRAGFGIVE